MAEPPQRRTVIYATSALCELDAIWQWNAATYGPSRADAYLRFLLGGIDKLGRTCSSGRRVAAEKDLQYRLLRRKSKGHGHVAVYRVVGDFVRVLHVFHTAQDWQAAAADE